MNEVKIGATLMLKISGTETPCGHKYTERPGKVVYIHPEGRFFMAEFDIERLGFKAKIRECYPIDLSKTPMQEKLRSIFTPVSGSALRGCVWR